jgi:predicted lipoprotein
MKRYLLLAVAILILGAANTTASDVLQVSSDGQGLLKLEIGDMQWTATSIAIDLTNDTMTLQGTVESPVTSTRAKDGAKMTSRSMKIKLKSLLARLEERS